MAKHLEDLAHHFGQMETALNEHEAGDVVGEEDMGSMSMSTETSEPKNSYHTASIRKGHSRAPFHYC